CFSTLKRVADLEAGIDEMPETTNPCFSTLKRVADLEAAPIASSQWLPVPVSVHSRGSQIWKHLPERSPRLPAMFQYPQAGRRFGSVSALIAHGWQPWFQYPQAGRRFGSAWSALPPTWFCSVSVPSSGSQIWKRCWLSTACRSG